MTHAARSDDGQLICHHIKCYFGEKMVNLKLVQQQNRLVLVFVLFFLLSQLVAKLNVLVREMTHQQPEVLRRWGKFLFHFSFYSLRISFHCNQCCRLLMLAACFSLHCLIISSVLLMANSPLKSVLFWPYVIICSASMLSLGEFFFFFLSLSVSVPLSLPLGI